MNKFYQVEGHPSLLKNPVTGVIVSNNPKEAEHARVLKTKMIRDREEKEQMNKDINGLKSEMSEIKSLLKQLVEKENDN